MARSKGIWLIYVLTIEGSYSQNLERPAITAPDTMQYWISEPETLDIRTFAIDKEIRILQLDTSNFEGDCLQYFKDVAQRTYKAIIKNFYEINVPSDATDDWLGGRVKELGLFPNAKWTTLDFPLWLPEECEYSSLEE